MKQAERCPGSSSSENRARSVRTRYGLARSAWSVTCPGKGGQVRQRQHVGRARTVDESRHAPAAGLQPVEVTEVGLQDAVDVLLILLAHLECEPQQQAVVEQRYERSAGVGLGPIGQRPSSPRRPCAR